MSVHLYPRRKHVCCCPVGMCACYSAHVETSLIGAGSIPFLIFITHISHFHVFQCHVTFCGCECAVPSKTAFLFLSFLAKRPTFYIQCVGAEVEFCLHDAKTGKPVDNSIFCNSTTLNQQEEFISDLYRQLKAQQIPVEALHAESGT